MFGFDFAVFEGKKAIFEAKKLKCIVSGGIFGFLYARGGRPSQALRGHRGGTGNRKHRRHKRKARENRTTHGKSGSKEGETENDTGNRHRKRHRTQDTETENRTGEGGGGKRLDVIALHCQVTIQKIIVIQDGIELDSTGWFTIFSD